MNGKIRGGELAEFDPSGYLDDDEAVADCIRLTIEDGDHRLTPCREVRRQHHPPGAVRGATVPA